MVWTLSPTDVDVLIAGFHKIIGYPDGTFISLKKDSSPFTTSRTLDGEVARTFRNDQTYTLSLNIVQSSYSNDVLMKLYELDAYLRNSAFSVFIKDQKGSTIFLSAESWVQEVPDVTFSNGMEIRAWNIQCINSTLSIGGNADGSNTLTDIANIITAAIPNVRGLI